MKNHAQPAPAAQRFLAVGQLLLVTGLALTLGVLVLAFGGCAAVLIYAVAGG